MAALVGCGLHSINRAIAYRDIPTRADRQQAETEIITRRIRESGLVGKISDKELAARLGISPNRIRRYRYAHNIPHRGSVESIQSILSADPDVGRKSDIDIASRHNIHPSAVYRYRESNGIPPAPRRKHNPSRNKTARARILAHPLLGKTADLQIANEIGCSNYLVWKVRQENNIRTPRSWSPA